MFAWLRRIKVKGIKVFGVELEFDHSTSSMTQPEPQNYQSSASHTGSIRTQSKRSVASMVTDPPSFTVFGEVVGTIDKDLGIRIRNEAEVREFWRIHQIDSDLNWFGKGPPVFSIGRKADRAVCHPGDEARMTFQVEDRKNGKRGIRTIDFAIISAP